MRGKSLSWRAGQAQNDNSIFIKKYKEEKFARNFSKTLKVNVKGKCEKRQEYTLVNPDIEVAKHVESVCVDSLKNQKSNAVTCTTSSTTSSSIVFDR